jgi:hypothetical protein
VRNLVVAEYIQEHLWKMLEAISQNKMPSADMLLCELTELYADNNTIKYFIGNSYHIKSIFKRTLRLKILLI